MEESTATLPEAVEITNEEESLRYFALLEAFGDGMGGWKIQEVFGVPLLELPDWLVHDLMVLRNIACIMRRQRDERRRAGTNRGMESSYGKHN